MPVESISEFGQFGLAGVVIFALFYFLHGFLKELKEMNKTHDNRIEIMAKTHYEQIEAMNKMHNERHDTRNDLHGKERGEWLVAYKENTDVLRKNTEVLSTISERKCSAVTAAERRQNG
jgi:hypothetical protein